MEYTAALNKETEDLRLIKQCLKGQHDKLMFEAGVVVRYTNVHPETTRLVLKGLFEQVGQVSFVDHEKKQTHVSDISYRKRFHAKDSLSCGQQGHVRFKTPQAARQASQYFQNVPIYQIGKLGLGNLPSNIRDQGLLARIEH